MFERALRKKLHETWSIKYGPGNSHKIVQKQFLEKGPKRDCKIVAS